MSAESESTAEPAVVFLSGDLMFASRVRAAANAAGVAFHLSGTLPELDHIRWVIVDLATRSSVLDSLMDSCHRICPQARVIAYGPHVQVDKLERARQAGIEQVVTRGQFDRSLGDLFKPV